jgi:hypothetical protein
LHFSPAWFRNSKFRGVCMEQVCAIGYDLGAKWHTQIHRHPQTTRTQSQRRTHIPPRHIHNKQKDSYLFFADRRKSVLL